MKSCCRSIQRLNSFGLHPRCHSNTYHKRPLPTSLVALSSLTGKKLFKEALDLGGMETFFPLAEQFITQSEPSFCSLTSLAMVLNALNHDPGKTWKGVWRWISEETLQCEFPDTCGHSLSRVKTMGMNFSEFESLARCHDAIISSRRASAGIDRELNINIFRKQIKEISCSNMAKSFIVCNFSRSALDQTGDGHFSPIGGYHLEKDLVLIMDVARFKYPPFWVSVEMLWDSMSQKDAATGDHRGYFIISTNGKPVQAEDGITNIEMCNNHSHGHSHCGHDHNH
jgi:glutathione gamma-glutamylcysteinyltransferase